jgi:Zn-finger nucleic acid-binding protein
LWLGRAVLERLLEEARREAASAATASAAVAGLSDSRESTPQRSLYRPCPECQTLMNRRNFGSASGVILDSCHEHGMWFDAHELNRILQWIRSGGEARVRKREVAEAEQAARARRVAPVPLVMRDDPRVGGGGGSDWHVGRALVESLIELLFSRSAR